MLIGQSGRYSTETSSKPILIPVGSFRPEKEMDDYQGRGLRILAAAVTLRGSCGGASCATPGYYYVLNAEGEYYLEARVN